MQTFQYLIREFGVQLNAQGIEADEEGYIALTFDSQIVHLQYDEQLDEVAVFSQLGEIGKDRLAEVCLMLLAANQFWEGTQGATFSVEPTTKLAFMAERQPLSLLTVNHLNNWLERFLTIADYWTERLDTANTGGRLHAETDYLPQFLAT